MQTFSNRLACHPKYCWSRRHSIVVVVLPSIVSVAESRRVWIIVGDLGALLHDMRKQVGILLGFCVRR